jgi:hypothetical protein
VRKVFKKSIILLLVLFIPMVATSASADFLNSSLGHMRHGTEVIQMFLLGVGLFMLASLFRTGEK